MSLRAYVGKDGRTEQPRRSAARRRRWLPCYARGVDGEVANALRRYFDDHAPEIAVAYLFGSTARGTARPESDVDLAVLPGDPATGTLEALHLDLEDAIERHLGRTVQVVVLHLAPVDLVHRVLRDGVLVCERDRSKRIAFEVRARNEYFDLLPILERYRRRAS